MLPLHSLATCVHVLRPTASKLGLTTRPVALNPSAHGIASHFFVTCAPFPACENSAVPLSWSIRMLATNVVSGSNRNQGGLTIKTNSSCAGNESLTQDGLYSSSMVTDTAHTMRAFFRQIPTVRLSIGQPVGGAVDNKLENANTRSRVSLSFFASDMSSCCYGSRLLFCSIYACPSLSGILPLRFSSSGAESIGTLQLLGYLLVTFS